MTERDLLVGAADEIRRLRERLALVEGAVRRHRDVRACGGCERCRVTDRGLWAEVLDVD